MKKYMMNTLYRTTNWYFSKGALPYWCILAFDCCIIVISILLSLYVLRGGEYLLNHFWLHVLNCVIAAVCAIPGMKVMHTYSGIIRFSSFSDLLRISGAIVIAAIVSVVVFPFLCAYEGIDIDWKIVPVAAFFAMGLMWAWRVFVKFIFDKSLIPEKTPCCMIYGAQSGAIGLAKSIRSQHPVPYQIKGFISSDADMEGKYLLGSFVYNINNKLYDDIRRYGVKFLLVSPIRQAELLSNQEFIDRMIKANVTIMMWSQAEAWDGKTKISHTNLRPVDVEDLLPRDEIKVDKKAIGEMLTGRRILITGAAGSIGGEMVRQIAKFNPSEMVLIDQAETPMHDVRRYMAQNHSNLKCETIVTSITNESHMEAIFAKHRPEYVFHAAAYKHVPMMEDNPALAVQNNCHGTQVIADLSVKYGTKKFVMISTDKAVNPTNVMGCSKRICEIYCQSLNAKIHQASENSEALLTEDGTPAITEFVTTRFGNVLGSNGSVIPIFREQIRKGGPVTVTHPEIIRFFMLIPEACNLVLEAGTMGKGGEIFVFDMGKPVRIADMAKRMIDLSGAKGIEIKYTGLRDGEKLYEEVLNDEENTKPTFHPKIKIAQVREYDYADALANEERLYKASFTYDDMTIVKIMKEIVPEYKSKQSKYQVLD